VKAAKKPGQNGQRPQRRRRPRQTEEDQDADYNEEQQKDGADDEEDQEQASGEGGDAEHEALSAAERTASMPRPRFLLQADDECEGLKFVAAPGPARGSSKRCKSAASDSGAPVAAPAADPLDNDYFEILVPVEALPLCSDLFTLGGPLHNVGHSCARWRQAGKPWLQVAAQPVTVLAKLRGIEEGTGRPLDLRQSVIDELNRPNRALVLPPQNAERRRVLLGRYQTVSGIQLCEALLKAGVHEVVFVHYGQKVDAGAAMHMFTKWVTAKLAEKALSAYDLSPDVVNRADWGVNISVPGIPVVLFKARKARHIEKPRHKACRWAMPTYTPVKSVKVLPMHIPMLPPSQHDYGWLCIDFEEPCFAAAPTVWVEKLIVYSRHMHMIKARSGVSNWGYLPRTVGGHRTRLEALRTCVSEIMRQVQKTENSACGFRIEMRLAAVGIPSDEIPRIFGLATGSLASVSSFLVQHNVLEAPGIEMSFVSAELFEASVTHILATIDEHGLIGTSRKLATVTQRELLADAQSQLGIYSPRLQSAYGCSHHLWYGLPAPPPPVDPTVAASGRQRKPQEQQADDDDEENVALQELNRGATPTLELLRRARGFVSARQRALETSSDEQERRRYKVLLEIVAHAHLIPHPRTTVGRPGVTFQITWEHGGFVKSAPTAMSAAERMCAELTKSGIAIEDWRAHAKLAAPGETLDRRFKDADERYIARVAKIAAEELEEEQHIEAERRLEIGLSESRRATGVNPAAPEASSSAATEASMAEFGRLPQPVPPFEERLRALRELGVEVRQGYQWRVPRLHPTREELRLPEEDEGDDGLLAGDSEDRETGGESEEIPGIEDS
jgi:hypothetical protein